MIENDKKVFIKERGLDSLLKSKEKELFNKYTSLTNEEKVIADYCLNGILDLTSNSIDNQKRLFSIQK